MNDIIENEPNVTGVVEEVHDNYIVMYSETADGYPNGSRWQISLNVENTDSCNNIVVGDEIVVYHDGNVMETDPLKVGTVYAITLKTPANRGSEQTGQTDTGMGAPVRGGVSNAYETQQGSEVESTQPAQTDETLKNKLIYGATHDPNADNSEHAIDGPGKPLEPTE